MKNIVKYIVIALVASLVGYYVINKIRFSMNNEDTENSQIEATITPVSARISGYVEKVFVKDNQSVKMGDTLVVLDARDLALKVRQAEIAVQNAEANVELVKANIGSVGTGVQTSEANAAVSGASVETGKANVESAKIRVWKATQDFNRYDALVAQKSATQQQLDAAKAEKESAEAALVVAEKQLIVYESQTGVSKSQKNASKVQLSASEKQVAVALAQVEARKAELELAKLQLTYSAITAPSDGVVSRKNVQPGQLLNPGSPICQLVNDSELWVMANFKETQVGNMQVGQKVKLEADAFPEVELEGEIESISAATGAKFALLPPDNSSGNFVKVVQRIPVKITVLRPSDSKVTLRAGMNVHVVIPNL